MNLIDAGNPGMRALLEKSNLVESDCSEELDPGDPDLFYFWHLEEI